MTVTTAATVAMIMVTTATVAMVVTAAAATTVATAATATCQVFHQMLHLLIGGLTVFNDSTLEI